MCGICGIIHFNNKQVHEAPIHKMMQLMKHRGPDDEGIFIGGRIGLGFVRLSIIDLSIGGHQPMFSHDKKHVIVFNGEIYNYLELREELIAENVKFVTQTDTEVLLNAYLHWGEDCLDRFNGMWAFAIYDREKDTIFIARDRFGIKPLYYLRTNEYFAFCSEIPPILSLLDKKPTPNYHSIFDFLVFNRTDHCERTFFNEVLKLQHGHKLFVNQERISISKWYDLKERISKTVGFVSPIEFKELFSSAIGLHLRSDVPVGVCLSGGLDSSSIVSILLKDYNKTDLKTFSAVYGTGEVGDETSFIDEYKNTLHNMYFTSPNPETLAKDLNQFVKIQGEPIPGSSPYAQFKVMELAHGKVVVTLDGQGADEQLAGYHDFFGYYFKGLFLRRQFGLLLKEIKDYLIKHKSSFAIKSFIFFILPQKLQIKTRVFEKSYLTRVFVRNHQASTSVSKDLYGSLGLNDALIDHFEFKLEHLLKWEDRNSMWFSIEARVPFLDYRLVEKVLASSKEMKIKDGMTKYILRESMKGILPEKIRIRPDKVGFDTPQADWFRTDHWQQIILDVLNSNSFKERNLICPDIAIKQYHKHLKGKVNISKEIWKWVHLELWFREFID